MDDDDPPGEGPARRKGRNAVHRADWPCSLTVAVAKSGRIMGSALAEAGAWRNMFTQRRSGRNQRKT